MDIILDNVAYCVWIGVVVACLFSIVFYHNSED